MKRLSLLLLTLLLGASLGAQVQSFHNIPYAKAERYQKPVPIQAWDSSSDYSARGPQCPQTVTGNSMFKAGTLPQSEDCLIMSVNTPSMHPSKPLPVVVFIHGGSHHHGSGEWEIYDGSELSREQNVVTATISFRHGVFGYLWDEAEQSSSLGLEDQVEALRWIQRNIASFGGDPSNVTVTGQSAGAQSVVYLISTLKEKLFKRAIVFSAPFGLNQSTKKAAKNAAAFLEILGKDKYSATAEELVAAEKKFKKEVGGGSMAFCPSGIEQYNKNVKCGVEDVMVCYQADDGSMFAADFRNKHVSEFGSCTDMTLSRLVTNFVFKNGADKYAKCLQKQGINAHEYKFTWCPPGANWKAAHGLEIDFLYGTKEYVLGYGLVGDVTAEQYDQVSTSFRKTVADYARTGVWNCSFGELVR